MISYFKNLGERIEQAWRCHSYNEEIFPQLALDELGREPPREHVKVEDILDWIFGPHQAFVQPASQAIFGEPPVMLFQASRFYIEALFWLSGTTAVHEHSFSGAFAVLAGSSVHSHWRFALERTVNSRMLCGRLEREFTEILSAGSIKPIYSGDRLIHQLFHLESPSVTIVVRTSKERNHLPQYQYLPPGLAIDHEDHDALRMRRVLFLDGMARGGRFDELRRYAVKLIDSGDLETVYYMFSVLSRRKIEKGLLEDLYCVAGESHGAIIDLFHRTCDAERRTRIVTALRSKVNDSEPRFLLALLMLMPDRDAIFETIKAQFPGADPVAEIERWLSMISGKEAIGFDFNRENRLIFISLMEGLDAEGLLLRLRNELHDEFVEEHRKRLLDRAGQMARLELFYPLLADSPLR